MVWGGALDVIIWMCCLRFLRLVASKYQSNMFRRRTFLAGESIKIRTKLEQVKIFTAWATTISTRYWFSMKSIVACWEDWMDDAEVGSVCNICFFNRLHTTIMLDEKVDFAAKTFDSRGQRLTDRFLRGGLGCKLIHWKTIKNRIIRPENLRKVNLSQTYQASIRQKTAILGRLGKVVKIWSVCRNGPTAEVSKNYACAILKTIII